jgi:hypothetical protein
MASENQPISQKEVTTPLDSPRGFNAEVSLRQALDEIVSLRRHMAGALGGNVTEERVRELVEEKYLNPAGLPSYSRSENPTSSTSESKQPKILTPREKALKDLGLAPDILEGLNEDQIQIVLRGGFRLSSQIHHPDHGGSADRFKAVKESYDFLADPKNRTPKL